MRVTENGSNGAGRGIPGGVPRLVLFLAACALLSACSPPPAVAPPPAAKTEGTAVSPISADGIARWLKETRGKAAVVNLWATWCPPCVAEMPELNDFHQKADLSKVALLAVSVDDSSRLTSTVVPFVEKHRITFPVRVLEDTPPEALGAALGIDFSGAVPVTLLFSPSGELVKLWEGEVTARELQAALGAAE